LFKYINDVLAEYGKKNIALAKDYIYASGSTYVFYLLEKMKYTNISNLWKRTVPVEKKKPDPNKSVVTFNCENKMDLMALGNFLIKNKKNFKLVDYCRTICDIYKTTESYTIPDCVIVTYDMLKESDAAKDYQFAQDILIKIIQNVDFTLYCETDHKVEILKDASAKRVGFNNTIDITFSKFRALVNQYIVMPKDNVPPFISHKKDF
jgi:hypothetical protein